MTVTNALNKKFQVKVWFGLNGRFCIEVSIRCKINIIMQGSLKRETDSGG